MLLPSNKHLCRGNKKTSAMLKDGILCLSADPNKEFFKTVKQGFSKNDTGRQTRTSIESNYLKLWTAKGRMSSGKRRQI